MCGIAGFIGETSSLDADSVIKRMLDFIDHRGPDNKDFFKDSSAVLGSTRLSIIDLEHANMPITSPCGNYVIVYNGEIYNFPEIKEELKKKGHQFSRHSDTETVLHAYMEYGETCAKLFNGMFAIAIWDKSEKSLFIARDQIGQKPYYYSQQNGYFIFSSELKPILTFPNVKREVSSLGLNSYLNMGYTLPDTTMYEGIHKLPAGHYAVYKNGKLRIEKYWELTYQPDYNLSYDQMVQKVREKVIKAVESRMLSDVPISSFLSGGVDSTVVTGIVTEIFNQKIDTFTIGFSEKSGANHPKFNNDAKHARIVSDIFKTKHHEVNVSLGTEELTDLLDKIIWTMEEPCYAPTLVPLYCISESVAKNFKVSLTGDGGDELFAGYDMYRIENQISKLNYIPSSLSSALYKTLRGMKEQPTRYSNLFKRLKERKVSERYMTWKNIFPDGFISPQDVSKKEFNNLFEPFFKRNSSRNFSADMCLADIILWISVHTTNCFDRMSMANSLELRSSFLDHELVEFSQQIPIDYKLRGTTTKAILKEAFKDIIPENVLTRQTGSMLSPSSFWLKNHLRPMINEVLSKEEIAKAGLVDPEWANQIVQGHLNKVQYAMIPTWSLLSLHLWHRKFIQNNPF